MPERHARAQCPRPPQALIALDAAILPGGSSSSALPTPYSFDSRAAVLAWLSSSLVAPLFSPTVCGDGVCHSPFEYPAFGSLGCPLDCGSAPT